MDTRTGRRDASIYTDCFVLLGMAQDAQVRRREEAVPGVSALYNGIAERVAAGNYLTEPYPVPAGYRAHGIPMILLNVIACYIRMKKSFGMCCEEEIRYGLELTEDIWNSFYDGSYIREFRKNGSGRTRELLEMLETLPEFLPAFDSEVFTDLVERITAEGDGHLRFRLKNGLELIETTERSVR